YLYVTEVFIRKVGEYTAEEAREVLLSAINRYRTEKNLMPLTLSKSLSDQAQTHIDVQEGLNTLSPPLLLNLLARHYHGALHVNVYTSNIVNIPDEVHDNLDLDLQTVGIGFKRIRGKLCETGCYLVTLIFGPPL